MSTEAAIVLNHASAQDHLEKLKDIADEANNTQGIICVTDIGAWVVLERSSDDLVSAYKAVGMVNDLLQAADDPPDSVTRKVRIVADISALRQCLSGLKDNPSCKPSQPGDVRHVTTIPEQEIAFSIVEQLEPLSYFSTDLMDLVLPHFLTELILTDEMASVAIEKNHPEVACLIYGEAFRIDPYLAYQNTTKERFEMAALMAGDSYIEQFNMSAAELFEDCMDTSHLKPLPIVEKDFEILVSFPVDEDDRYVKGGLSVKANKGYDVHRQLLHFANLLMFRVHQAVVDSKDVSFFVDKANRLLAIWWTKADRKQRLELDLEAFNKFAMPVSGLEGISPNNPESFAAFQAIRQAGIPVRVAIQPLVEALQEIEQADEI